MASKFQKRLQDQKKSGPAAPAMPQVAASVAVRNTPAPTGNEDASKMRSELGRPAMEPSGQIVRVRADEIYEVEQVRPEEDFDEEVLSGMVESFTEFGNLTPPRCLPKDRKGYRVWFGATRVRSMKRRGDEFIDIYVGAPPRDERQRIMGQLIENLQQSGLKPLATAMAFEQLKNQYGMSGEEIAKALGKPTAFVSKHMRIGAAPEKITSLVRGKKLSDVELIYNLIQLNETDAQAADRIIARVNEGQTVTRAQVKRELGRIKDRSREPNGIRPASENEISHAKSEGKSEEHKAVTDNVREEALTLVVSVKGEEGRIMLHRAPEEFGWIWVKMASQEIYVQANDVTLIGLR